MSVAAFLARCPPFDVLGPDRLERVARSVQIEYFPAGSVILSRSGEPAHFLYLVRAGAVEVLDEERLVDLMDQGSLFGEVSLLSGLGPTATIRAHDDTLCYLIDEDAAREVLGTPKGLAFVTARFRERLAGPRGGGGRPESALVPVGSLVRRPPVTSPPSTTVRDAATLMAREHVSSLLVPVAGGWGILTDRDLRTRVLAAGRSPDTPVEEVMSSPAATVPREASAGDVLLRMLDGGFHHFPVVDPAGEVVGMVTDTDLLGLERQSPFALRAAIERAPDQRAVAERGRELPGIVVGLVESRVDPVHVGQVVALIVDALTRRLVQLGIEELGDPPTAWAWLTTGSGARREQALRSDQDHILVLGDEERSADGYFGTLAARVTAGLEAAGIPRCRGGMMAENEDMRRSLDGWVARFRAWMADPGVEGSVFASILFDYRHVAGPLAVVPQLDDMLRTASEHPTFLRHLSHRALDERPPTGFFRHLVVEARGEHAGTLDVKRRGIMLITELARGFALRAGSVQKETLARLGAAASSGLLDGDLARGLEEAFRLLWELRLEHQVARVRQGLDPDDHVDPGSLGPLSRQEARAAFRIILDAQSVLASELGVLRR